MRKSVDEMLKELHTIDKENNYSIRYLCGRWQIRNKRTCEGIDTDAGYSKAQKWLLNDRKTEEMDISVSNGKESELYVSGYNKRKAEGI